MLICIPSGALFIDTLLPYFLSQSIGGLSTQDQQVVMQNLVWSSIVGIIGALLNFIGFQFMARHEARVRTSLGDETFAQIIKKDARFFVDTKVGALTSRYIDFVRSETTLQDLLIIRTLGFVISLSAGIILLSIHSLPVGMFILALVIALVLEVRWSIKIRTPLRHARKTLIGEIHGWVADAVTNNVIVKTFANEDGEIKALNRLNQRLAKVYIKDVGFLASEGSARLFLTIILQIIAIAGASYLVFNGGLDIALIIFALTYLQRLSSQIFTLGDILTGYDQALLDAAPMSDMLTKKDTIIDKHDATKLQDIVPTVELQNVNYHYDENGVAALNNINLEIPAGQRVGLVGHSGAGKTTITQLLLRFDDVTSGAILLGGHDIRDVTQKSLRTQIAYVPQEPLLFHRSLRENIAYGNRQANDDAIRSAAKHANALEFIEKLPDGFDTLVGERGVKLSGGQRQRIAIARAILKDAPILLLDEATSALDSESEKLIQQSLETLMKGRTSIVIAHRLSTIAKLDRIVVLEKGKIIEDGTHTELLKQKGVYASLWAHQSGGFIEE